jgi:hypothetical protein
MVQRDWGSMAAGWSTARGRGRPWQGFALGLPYSSSMPNPKRQRGGLESPGLQREIPSRSPSLYLLAKEKKRERERKILWRSRVFIPGIQISI